MTFNDFPSEYPADGECDIIIMGVPTDVGSGEQSGQRFAPDKIRDLTFWDTLFHPFLKVDLGRLTVVDVGNSYVHHGDVIQTHESIVDYVTECAPHGELLVTLGGDHSITPHVIKGLREAGKSPATKPPLVIHLDAHADIGSHEDYEGYGTAHHGSWVRYALDEGLASEVHTIGVRAMGPEAEWYKKSPRAHQYMHRPGNAVAVNHVIDLCYRAHSEGRPVYLTVDLDVVDPAFAPGVVYPEPGGMFPQDLINIVQTTCSFKNVIGVDIVEAVPALDLRDATLRLASRCVIAAMTGYYLSRTQPTTAEVEARRGEMRPVPHSEGEDVPDTIENKSLSPQDEGVEETKSTGDYDYEDIVESDEDDEGSMGTRATTAVKASGRGRGKKTASKKRAKKTAAKKSTKKATSKKAAKKTTKKAAKAPARKNVAPTAKKAAKAPAKSSKKAAKKVAKKRA